MKLSERKLMEIVNAAHDAMATMVVMTFLEVSVKMPCDLCHKVSAEASIFYRCLQGPGLVNLPALATKLGRFTEANVPAKPKLAIFLLVIGWPCFFKAL